jgi:hypothetical protein
MKVKFDFKELERFNDKLQDKAELHKHYRVICKELADELKKVVKSKTPVKTGNLKSGWDGQKSYLIRKNKNGYSITLYNRVPYADAVNYGHYSYNQFNVGGEPYVVRNRHVPYYDGNSDDTFVFGHFFVEKSVLELENNPAVLEQIMEKELLKWWRWCVNGK